MANLLTQDEIDCQLHGCTIESINSTSEYVRLCAYESYDCWTQDAYNDSYEKIRLGAYQKLGWREEAYNDHDSEIRKGAYENLGWTTKAFDEDDYHIRFLVVISDSKEIWAFCITGLSSCIFIVDLYYLAIRYDANQFI